MRRRTNTVYQHCTLGQLVLNPHSAKATFKFSFGLVPLSFRWTFTNIHSFRSYHHDNIFNIQYSLEYALLKSEASLPKSLYVSYHSFHACPKKL